MPRTAQPLEEARRQGACAGFAASFHTRYSAVAAEPLPATHVDLILALRRQERERARGADRH